MGKKTLKKRQTVYKMKGCSKKTSKNYLGKRVNTNLNYITKGGDCSIDNLTPLEPLIEPLLNINGSNKTLPNTGPTNLKQPTPFFLNPQTQKGGTCGTCGLMKGGSCGACGLIKGGKKRNKKSFDKKKQFGGNKGILYPNGIVGNQWSSSSQNWPGVDGIQGNRNYLPLNQYKTDVQTAIKATGAQPPFSVGGKKHTRKQKGGAFSNFLGQDLINLGRQIQFGLGSTYNALAGYSPPVNPLPWKGQLSNIPSLNAIRTSST